MVWFIGVCGRAGVPVQAFRQAIVGLPAMRRAVGASSAIRPDHLDEIPHVEPRGEARRAVGGHDMLAGDVIAQDLEGMLAQEDPPRRSPFRSMPRVGHRQAQVLARRCWQVERLIRSRVMTAPLR